MGKLKSIERTARRLGDKYELEDEDVDTIKHMLESVVENRDRRITELEQRERRYMATRSVTERRISGALRSTIQAHGPITTEGTGSAAKRLYGQMVDIVETNDEESNDG